MRLVLEIVSGPDAGKKCWLRTGQMVDVGRTEEAGFVIPYDARMSSRHFLLQCERGACHVRDLNSKNGTLVNGNRVQEVLLADRDTILAGDTRFIVHLEGAEPAAHPPTTRATSAPSRTAARVDVPQQGVQHRWICTCIPPSWRSLEHAYRQEAAGVLPSSLVLIEGPLPKDVTLNQYVNTQATELTQAISGASLEGPLALQVPGAEEALQFTLRYPPLGEFVLVQRYLHARWRELLGSAVLTTSEADWHARQFEFARLLDGLIMQASTELSR